MKLVGTLFKGSYCLAQSRSFAFFFLLRRYFAFAFGCAFFGCYCISYFILIRFGSRGSPKKGVEQFIHVLWKIGSAHCGASRRNDPYSYTQRCRYRTREKRTYNGGALARSELKQTGFMISQLSTRERLRFWRFSRKAER